MHLLGEDRLASEKGHPIIFSSSDTDFNLDFGDFLSHNNNGRRTGKCKETFWCIIKVMGTGSRKLDSTVPGLAPRQGIPSTCTHNI